MTLHPVFQVPMCHYEGVLKRGPLRKHEDTLHGPDHWERVVGNGLQLLAAGYPQYEESMDFPVRLFGLYHDSERLNEDEDPEHGTRAAKFLAKSAHFEGVKHFPQNRKLMLSEVLSVVEACNLHTSLQPDSRHFASISNPWTKALIAVCLDADRLDLPRVGITPSPEFMFTEPGKRRAQLMQEEECRQPG